MSTSTIDPNPVTVNDTVEPTKQDWGPPNTPETNDKLSIRVRDLNLWYGDFQALQDVNIDIRKGIITGLILGGSIFGISLMYQALNILAGFSIWTCLIFFINY